MTVDINDPRVRRLLAELLRQDAPARKPEPRTLVPAPAWSAVAGPHKGC